MIKKSIAAFVAGLSLFSVTPTLAYAQSGALEVAQIIPQLSSQGNGSSLPKPEYDPNKQIRWEGEFSQILPIRGQTPTPPNQFVDGTWREVLKKYPEDRVHEVLAMSPSMDGRVIPLVVIKAKDADRPTLYLMNGAGGGEQSVNWVSRTNVIDFYLAKNINVVIPMRGAFSYYTDWNEEIPQGRGNEYLYGKNKWETFLTKELPPVIEPYLEANDKRGIAGMSMSATSALLMAEHNQGFYGAVGSFSGCAETSTPLGQLGIQLTVGRGGVLTRYMWGNPGSETNRYNDALVQAEGLRGSEVYISSGNGLARPEDRAKNILPEMDNNFSQAIAGSAVRIAEGGPIEMTTLKCTRNMKTRTDALNIPIYYKFHNAGLHAWSLWKADLVDSWPVFAKGLGLAHEI